MPASATLAWTMCYPEDTCWQKSLSQPGKWADIFEETVMLSVHREKVRKYFLSGKIMFLSCTFGWKIKGLPQEFVPITLPCVYLGYEDILSLWSENHELRHHFKVLSS